MRRATSILMIIQTCLLLFLALCSTSVSADLNSMQQHEDDHELLAALEIFAGMSEEEMVDTINQMKEMMGDDPEAQAELQMILDLIPEIRSNSDLLQMAKDDEIAVATNDALRMIGDSDWETVWEMQDVILEAVLESGKLSPEDAATFRTDEKAWETELKFIYDQLRKQAGLEGSSEGEL